MVQYELGNKNVVITGGANGIGEQLVQLFVKKGSNVVFVDIDREKGQKLERQLFGKAVFMYGDISNGESVREVVNNIVHKFKHVHILINNAGIMRSGKFVETDFEDVIKTNLIGTMNITQLLLPFMEKTDKILNVLSIHAYVVRENKISYDVSNAGLLMFTQSLALELKERGISVNALSFSAAKTKMMDVDSYNKRNKNNVSEPLEIANHIINILESFSPYTTGSNFVVDGI